MKVKASYHQQRLWFIHQFEAGNLYEAGPVYHNIPLILELKGVIDRQLVEESIKTVIQRHGALRTRIVTEENRPLQIIEPEVAFKLEHRDLTQYEGDDKENHARALALDFVKRPFSIDGELLIRAQWIQTREHRSILVIGLHHITADRYSLTILTREIFSIYNSLLKGEPHGLPALSAHYADFSQWQNGLPADTWEPLLFYWRRKLTGKLQPLELPMDIPRPAIHVFSEGHVMFPLERQLFAKIEAFCRQNGIEKSLVMLGAFKVLLHKYSGQNEIVVGMSEDNRDQPGLEHIVGPIANLVVLRSFPDAAAGFLNFLRGLAKTVKDAKKYKDLPFEKLDQEIKPGKDMSRTVFFDVLYRYEDAPLEMNVPDHLEIVIPETNLGLGKYDLNLLIREDNHHLRGFLVYNGDYYDAAFIDRFAGHYTRVLEVCTESPDLAISNLSILTAGEKSRLLEEFSGRDDTVGYPLHKTIHEIFAGQAAQSPDRTALLGQSNLSNWSDPSDLSNPSGLSITYRELHEQSGRLALILKEKGMKPNMIAGIMINRSIEMIMAILAVLKAGAAYLPIDPDYPPERIDFMLKDSGAGLLLNTGFIESTINRTYMSNLSYMSYDPTSLAYIIYTSGTTGRPKGVMIEHRHVVRLLFNDKFPFAFDRHDIWTMFHSYCFDFSVWEMYGALLYGAKLVLVPKMTARDTGMFWELLRDEKVTVLNQTPPAFYRLVQEELKQQEKPLCLRYVIFGGETLSPGKLKQWQEKYPGTCLINMFGITETTVHVTYKELTTREIDLNINNIGKPIPTLRVYILDKNHRLAPLGIPGEIWVGGDGVARGYLNRPELTAEKFISIFNRSPRSDMPYLSSSALYKTGDLAKFTANGDMVYLGRLDTQVKIRGHRIECGEIENRLIDHVNIKDAVVIDRPDKDGTRYLCAYVVLRSPAVIDSSPAGLKDYLAAKLPGYMVPSYIITLTSIPLTPNGKVDREALPEPEFTAARQYEAPGSELEKKLVEIWDQVLGRDKDRPLTGIHDNFFDLGGHSLNATVMTSMVREMIGVRVPLAEVFISPTVRGLADYIRAAEKEPVTSMKPVEEKEYYELSNAQRRLWIICQFEDESTAYVLPAVFVLKGKLETKVFIAALRTLGNRQESLRTTFITIQGEPRQKISRHFALNLDQEDLCQLEALEKERQARNRFSEFANRPFNLETGPLFRVKLVRLGQEEYLLLANIHHIITDGWSQGIIFKETVRLYNALLAGKDNPLPRLGYRYKDYTAWHNRMAATGQFSAAQEYWLTKFNDKPNGLELPLDHPRQARQTFNGGTVHFIIDEEKTAALKQISGQRDATLFMGYLTLLSIFLYRYTNQEDMILGLAISGRDHPELRGMIGFLVNTLVFRHTLDPGRGFRQLLEAARQETLDCYRHQDYPFNLLVEKLDLERDLSRSPLFNVMLSHNNTGIEDAHLKMTGLETGAYEDTRGFNMSVFDLVFFMNDAGSRIVSSIMYNSDLFERSSLEAMARNFRALWDSVLKAPDRPVKSLDCIAAGEYETILDWFNDNRYAYPRKTVQELFEEQVEKSPDRTAVVYNEEKISYRELNKKANHLAHFLRQESQLRPNDIAAVAFERSLEMIMTILGILKAGGGYLAIDPNYPADRVLHMLTDSASPLLITDKQRPALFGNYRGRIIDIHAEGEEIARQPGTNPTLVNRPRDTIYVIYTSGSTGTPNGAMLSQDILANLLLWQRDKTGIDGSLRCLQFTTTSFCVSFQEIMTTLTNGGQLFLIGDIERQDIDYLMDFLTRHHIENLYLPFSYLNFLFNESQRFGPGFRHCLTNIITAGEQLKITSGLKSFLEANPQIRLHNHYGSSEMHVVTSYTLDARTAARNPVPPAGKPIANTKIYILDPHRNPVPIGVWGELAIAGCSEIKGYINNESLTDKKLLHHPLAGENNRLYCSGDIGRWQPDGNIQLKGRLDTQVKIRGFRVEPSEIESKVLAIDRVKDCVVEIKTDPRGQKYLAAYVVTQALEIPEIKKIISAYLPQHMIPKFVKLDSLPLMPNGKVDRERLPEPRAKEGPVREVDPRPINALLATGVIKDPRWETGQFLYEKAGMENLLAYYTQELQEQFFSAALPLTVSGVEIRAIPAPHPQNLQGPAELTPRLTQPRRQILDFDRLPIPNRSLVDYEKYGKRIGLAMVKNTISLQATRGCPYNCLYCHKIWPKHHAARSAQNIFKELELYYRMGYRRFVFVDDIFNLDLQNSREFFNLIIDNGLEVRLFFPNGLRTDLLTREYIDLMVKAGTVSLGLALETASPRLQKLIKKNLDLEKLRENVQYLCEKYPQVILELFLMHGFPSETEEEAISTLDFLKGLKWIDFPYYHLLKIYPNTEMAEMAIRHGISKQAILASANLAFHEIPQTLPFDKPFTLSMQADFLNNYFLLKERLLARLPHQMNVLTRDEIIQKYDSYLPVPINSIADLMQFTGISGDELPAAEFMADRAYSVPGINQKMRARFPGRQADEDALRVLLLDLSQFFTDHGTMLYDGVEPPLGLIYLLTYLNREFGPKVKGKIAKSRTDFDSYRELMALLEEFRPDVIGIRTLTFYSRFFHQAAGWIRQWGYAGPIIAGGPYATSDYETVLQDKNIDLVVLSEGEVTFAELLGKIMAGSKRLPPEKVLETIPGIAFMPKSPEDKPAPTREGAYAYVFNMSNPRVLAAVSQGRSQAVFTDHPGPYGIDLLEFDTGPGPAQENIPVEIRVMLNSSLATDREPGGEEKQQPRGELETKLVEIWANVLGIDKAGIGSTDNFFDLGGHSLKATTLASRLHKELDVKVPLAQVFKLPTIRELAHYIKGTAAETFNPIEPVEEKENYELSSAQQRIYIRQRLNPEDTSYNNPVFLTLEGELRRRQLERAFAKIIRRHESLRTSFAVVRETPVQRIHENVAFEIHDPDPESRGPTAKSSIHSFVRPFDLSSAPLLRVEIVKEEENKHLLMIDIHHIITDGVSIVVFAREMMALYGNRALPPLRCRYRDFSQWQNRLFTSAEIKKQENYWLKQFESEIPVLNIAADFPRPLVQRLEGSQVKIEIQPRLTEQIERLAGQSDATVYIVLLTVCNILFFKYSGQEDIILGVTIAGRRHADLENIMGMFVNMLALRNRPGANKTFEEFLGETRDNTLDAFDHQDYPYETLVKKLDLQGNPGRNALFDIVFKLDKFEIPEIILPGSTLKPEGGYQDTTCKFDMVISADHEPGSLVMNFKYSTHLFKETTIRTMANHFLEIVEQVAANRQIKLKAIDLSSALTAARVEVEEAETLFEF